mgnify:CR=1 FL=1|jgi:hypothetical protein
MRCSAPISSLRTVGCPPPREGARTPELDSSEEEQLLEMLNHLPPEGCGCSSHPVAPRSRTSHLTGKQTAHPACPARAHLPEPKKCQKCQRAARLQFVVPLDATPMHALSFPDFTRSHRPAASPLAGTLLDAFEARGGDIVLRSHLWVLARLRGKFREVFPRNERDASPWHVLAKRCRRLCARAHSQHVARSPFRCLCVQLLARASQHRS